MEDANKAKGAELLGHSEHHPKSHAGDDDEIFVPSPGTTINDFTFNDDNSSDDENYHDSEQGSDGGESSDDGHRSDDDQSLDHGESPPMSSTEHESNSKAKGAWRKKSAGDGEELNGVDADPIINGNKRLFDDSDSSDDDPTWKSCKRHARNVKGKASRRKKSKAGKDRLHVENFC